MTSSEFHQYSIHGRASYEDWQVVLSVIMRYGIEVESPSHTVPHPNDQDPTYPREPLALPYHLREIRSRDQYIAEEHALEYWPAYVHEAEVAKRAKQEDVIGYRGFRALLSPRPRTAWDIDEWQRLEYGRRLGLELVKPRTEVGFPAEPTDNPRYRNDTVVTFGSLADYVKKAQHQALPARPWAVNKGLLHFLSRLVDSVEKQIDTESIESDS